MFIGKFIYTRNGKTNFSFLFAHSKTPYYSGFHKKCFSYLFPSLESEFITVLSLTLKHIPEDCCLSICFAQTCLDLPWINLFPRFDLLLRIQLTKHHLYQQVVVVTCSRHLNLTDFEVGASCSIALQGKAKTGYPRVSRGSFFTRLRIFSVLLCTFFIYSFSFFQNIDRRIHIPVHPVSTFAQVCPF